MITKATTPRRQSRSLNQALRELVKKHPDVIEWVTMVPTPAVMEEWRPGQKETRLVAASFDGKSLCEYFEEV
jgi:hypothetical protein